MDFMELKIELMEKMGDHIQIGYCTSLPILVRRDDSVFDCIVQFDNSVHPGHPRFLYRMIEGVEGCIVLELTECPDSEIKDMSFDEMDSYEASYLKARSGSLDDYGLYKTIVRQLMGQAFFDYIETVSINEGEHIE